MIPPVIFLDIDGVLNNAETFVALGSNPLDPQAVRLFLGLVADTGAKVVLSSTWRIVEEAVDKLRRNGILDAAHADWHTVWCVGGGHWGREIAEWLSRHFEVTNYVILDDDSDMLPEQVPYFVQTKFETGLLSFHCVVAQGVLRRGRPLHGQ